MADEENAYSEEEAGILARAKAWFKEARPTRSLWFEEAKECYAFVAGDQWSEEDKSKLKEQMRPCITFNRIGPVVNSVSGSEVSNRQEVRYIPREQNDTGVNEILTQAAEWVRDECDAGDEESDAFVDLIISGMAWTETRVDYETNSDGKICIERVDPVEMWWDHRSKRRNLDDARYVMRVKDVPLDEAKTMFPGKEDFELDAKWAREFGEDAEKEPHDATEAPWYKDNQPENKSVGKRVRLVEVQWWDREASYRTADPADGKEKKFSQGEWDDLEPKLKKIGKKVKSVKQMTRKYYRAFLGAVVLEESDSPCENSFTYKSMTGYRDRNRNLWYGLIKAAIDPQRWANKWLAQTLHILNSQAKGGLLAEKTAFDNVAKAEDNWSSPDKIVWLNNGGLQKVKERTIGQMPSGFEKAMEWGIVAIRDSTGVSVEFQGLADRQQAGVLEYQRKQAALSVLATLFDGLRRYRKEQGRLLLHMIQKYISDERLIRVVGNGGEIKYLPLVKQPDTIEYDVIVDDAPDAPNMKERVWAVLQSMMPVLQGQNTPPQIWAEILKYSPLPETLTYKLGNILTQSAQQQLPPEVQKQMQDLTEENAQLKDKRAEKQAELQMKQQGQQADMQMKQQGQQADHQMKREQMAAEFQLKQAELVAELKMEQQKLNAELMMKMREMMMDMQTEKLRIAGDMQVSRMDMAHKQESHDADLTLSAAKAEAMKKQGKANGRPDRSGK